ncbi:MAG TPA: nickel-type superoxide dismutase maturation protease [Actinomycetota bacterium]|nr:nickel-type superoxide dismutase maturation protease [Actinomycetota bacterium]
MVKHPVLGWAAGLGVAAGAALWLSRRYIPVKVQGPSMLPTLRPGDWLIVSLKAKPRVGDIVVARRDDGLEIVKRVARIDDSGVELIGDNAPMSTDSRTIGVIAPDQIIGVAKPFLGIAASPTRR